MSFDGIFKHAQRFVSTHTPAILTGLTIAGTLSTAVLAVQATPQALRDISEAESERVEPLTNLEKVQLCWRSYLPSAAVGTLTIATAIGAQSINHRRQAALMSIYALSETSFREYRDKAREIVGEEKDREIVDAVSKEHLMDVPMVQSEVILTGSGETLCFDSISSRYFRSDMETIRRAINDVNEQCLSGDNVSMNEFYHKIGLSPTSIGEELGWRFDNLMEIDFTAELREEKSQPALALNYRTNPIPSYYKING